MENCPLRYNTIGQLYPECMPEAKSRFWQSVIPSAPRAELICPEPRRVTSVPYVLDGLNRLGAKSKGIKPLHRGNRGLEVLDMILNKDDFEGDSDASPRMGFFCGSPPVRTNNPVVHDAQFAKQTMPSASPLGISFGTKTSSRLERGSPSCGSPLGASPKVRIEGFACGSPESRHIVQALA